MQQIATALNKIGMTNTDFAAYLGYTRQNVQNILRNKCRVAIRKRAKIDALFEPNGIVIDWPAYDRQMDTHQKRTAPHQPTTPAAKIAPEAENRPAGAQPAPTRTHPSPTATTAPIAAPIAPQRRSMLSALFTVPEGTL